MSILRIIERKRDGEELSEAEIQTLIAAYVRGEVPDYQMSALAMAVCIRGMTLDETAALTSAMVQSGDRMWRPDASGPTGHDAQRPAWRIDKHSTGGVGDKVSLILAPMMAALGLHVPMISGRGLGFTGGTLDKLESIDGFRTRLSESERQQSLDRCGVFIVGADETIAPADRRLYALRDVTGTVPSLPLITSSILSKKLAASLDGLVMDVKVGSGAMMKTIDDAESLTQSLIQTGNRLGLPMIALLTDMDQPLGRAIGNAIEVRESVAILAGDRTNPLSERLRDLCVQLAVAACELAARCGEMPFDPVDAERRANATLDDGSALKVFEQMIHAQGGHLDIDAITQSSCAMDAAADRSGAGTLPLATMHELVSTQSGTVQSIATDELGRCVVEMGGGRQQVGDRINFEVGVEVLACSGDSVDVGRPLVRVFCDRLGEDLATRILAAFVIHDRPAEAKPLIINRMDSQTHP